MIVLLRLRRCRWTRALNRSHTAAFSLRCAVTCKRVPGRLSSSTVHATRTRKGVLCLATNFMNNMG